MEQEAASTCLCRVYSLCHGSHPARQRLHLNVNGRLTSTPASSHYGAWVFCDFQQSFDEGILLSSCSSFSVDTVLVINFAGSFTSFSQMMGLLSSCSGLFHSLLTKLIELISESPPFAAPPPTPPYVLVLKKLQVLFEVKEKLMASGHNLTNFYNRHYNQGQMDC